MQKKHTLTSACDSYYNCFYSITDIKSLLVSAEFVYWAATPIPGNPSFRINNVEFQYERDFHPNVENAVMATSYALLCYLAYDELAAAVPVMKWIHSQHNTLMGWSSTQVQYNRPFGN